MRDVIISELNKLGVGKINPGRNGWLNCCCPFHKDNDPSFGVNENNGAYYCFGCGIRGNNIHSFLRLVYGKDVNVDDFVTSQQFILSKINGKYQKNLDEMLMYENDAVFQKYYDFIKIDFTPAKTSKIARPYLESRKLDLSKINDGIILFAPNGDYAGRLIFPLTKKVGFHSRLITQQNSGKWKMCVNNFQFQRYVHGVESCDDRYCIIVESIIDRLYLLQNGFKNVITTLSTNFTTEQYLAITKFKKYIFCYDNDENQSGQNATIKHIRFILTHMSGKECYRVNLPNNKDPNDCTQDELKAAFGNIKKMTIK